MVNSGIVVRGKISCYISYWRKKLHQQYLNISVLKLYNHWYLYFCVYKLCVFGSLGFIDAAVTSWNINQFQRFQPPMEHNLYTYLPYLHPCIDFICPLCTDLWYQINRSDCFKESILFFFFRNPWLDRSISK